MPYKDIEKRRECGRQTYYRNITKRRESNRKSYCKNKTKVLKRQHRRYHDVKPNNLCECGCGGLTRWRFVRGHSKKPKAGQTKMKYGWLMECAPDHPFAHRGYVLQHRLVYERHYECCLLRWVDIHHINGIQTDNRIENLQPLTRGKHITIHNYKRWSSPHIKTHILTS